MADFDPIFSLAGGLLIGLASVLLMTSIGRIAGISSITLGVLKNTSGDRLWCLAFLGGLMAAPVLYGFITGMPVPLSIADSTPALVISGVLVGFGTTLSGGCTSGHGVCGMGRLSMRSFVSVIVFMTSAFAVYSLTHHGFGWLS